MAGGAQRFEPQEKYASMIRALDPRTVETKWEYSLQAKTQSGLVSTASDLIFGGSVDGYFYALDATDGKELWRMSVGGQVKAAPMNVDRVGASISHLVERVVLENVQHLDDVHAARARRGHRRDRVSRERAGNLRR